MTFSEQAGICLFPLIVLLIVYADNRSQRVENRADRVFSWMVASMFLCLVSYLASWLPNGRAWPCAAALTWGTHILYFISVSLVTVVYTYYVFLRAYPELTRKASRRLWTLLFLPAYASALLALTAPLTNALFTVNAQNAYVRGGLYAAPYAVQALYLALNLTLCALRMRRAPNRAVYEDCRLMFHCMLAPMFGILLQGIFSVWLALPLMSFLVFAIYITVQNRRITVDGLTGLNNRYEMNRHLAALHKRAEPCALLYMDVDDFKSINDTCGHVAGDEALCRVADILREQFSAHGSFLCRAGGDEFAIILPCADAGEAEIYIEKLRAAVMRANERKRAPYALSLSVGCALSPADSACEIDALVSAADEAMYAEKTRKKALRAREGGAGA